MMGEAQGKKRGGLLLRACTAFLVPLALLSASPLEYLLPCSSNIKPSKNWGLPCVESIRSASREDEMAISILVLANTNLDTSPFCLFGGREAIVASSNSVLLPSLCDVFGVGY